MNVHGKRLLRKGCPAKTAKELSFRPVQYLYKKECRLATSLARDWVKEFGKCEVFEFFKLLRELLGDCPYLLIGKWSWMRATKSKGSR